jgi:Protein of unknown function (DUF3223)
LTVLHAVFFELVTESDAMPSKAIKLGDLEFARKGDAVEFLKKMLNRYNPGDRVSDQDGQVLALALARHPDADKKIGCGIAHFNVRTADFGTQCFWVTRTDGTTERFAFRSCL